MAAKNLGLPLTVLHIISGIFLILLGLYLGQWLMWLTYIEKLGQNLWRVISPQSKKLIPINTLPKAFSLGILWGWLPCGLIYSTLTWALASANALHGALIMLAFGLGTLPALITMSLGIDKLKYLLSHQFFRKLMALLLIIYGIYQLTIA